MHTIKSSARREAWRPSDPESRTVNYNPFARSTSYRPRRLDEEEGGLQHSRTADSEPTQAETDRRARNQEDYSHPARAGTEPTPNNASEKHHHHGHHGHGHQSENNGEHAGVVGGLTHGTDTNDHAATPHEQKDVSFADDTQSRTLTNGSSSGKHGGESSAANGHNDEKHGLRSRFLHKSDKHEQDDGKDHESKKGHASIWKRRSSPWQEIKAVVFGSWVNILLLAVPISFALNYSNQDGKIIFAVSFIAIIPLASMLSFATEELATYVGETLGGLLNASFGNATELIISIIALKKGEILIVQTSLIGSILSNLLLVLGMCFFFGGVNRVKQHFNITVAQTASSLLALAVGSLIIPTAFVRFGQSLDQQGTEEGVAPISRGTSVILLLVYGAYLFFQLRTHTDMYNEPSKKVEKRKSSHKVREGAVKLGISKMGAGTTGHSGVDNKNLMDERSDDGDDEKEEPTLSLISSLITLGIATVLIAFCSEFLVTGISALTATGAISQEFIGLILLPIVGNAAEHATAVTVAVKDKMDLAIGVAVGSSMQIALLVLPLMVVIGWCGLGQPQLMSLDFDGFQITVMFIAVLLVNYLIQDGESHWLEGVLLMATYIIIALAAFFYPVTENLSG